MESNIPQVINGIPINWYILLSATLFIIGIIGVLLRRNTIIIFMCIELMLLAVNTNFIAFSHFMNDLQGQIFVFFIFFYIHRTG